MSTSPTFKYRGPDKRCPFPFTRDSATVPASYYDYVILSPSGGDEGLAEACRLWWLLEEVEFTPEGQANAFNDVLYFVDFTGSVTATNTTAPVDRVSESSKEFLYRGGDQIVSLKIAYTSSQWRLYYVFNFSASIQLGETDYLQINMTNPANAWYPEVTGSFLLFGYTLGWGATAQTSLGVVPWVEAAGLSASSTFYTLV